MLSPLLSKVFADEMRRQREADDDRKENQDLRMQGGVLLQRHHQDHDEIVAQRRRERDRHADRALLPLRPDAQRNAQEDEAQRGHGEDDPLRAYRCIIRSGYQGRHQPYG